ncbi:efflux RND transporter periplasmic adaptor subunit [Sedimentibacter sp. zth1]|uniref:efflux RND transporter periplasmic adaptor subunit n=1 Tax=Sedimentibacter sp. zth1 TaxID=2816908 RepID=UPI001A93A51B|nr:efflux RND transporter periplasmic adaptor subunit [Sedimentibacter sp. zth1]QSX06956.1 efflux RND transporter periplasmic adaptor subunit [Sedimentibacter sp. zth1]
MVKKIISIVIVFALVFAGGYFTCLQLLPEDTETNSGPVYATKDVTRGDIQVGVNITGQLQANYGGTISAPTIEGLEASMNFKVEEVFVGENDAIKKGDKIVRLSSTNLPKLISDKNDLIHKKQEEINEAVKALGLKVNKDISSVYDVNPSDGIVISAPIDGKVTDLQVKEGEKITNYYIANIINDSTLKISFMVKPDEYPMLVANDNKILISFIGYEGYYEAEITELEENPSTTTITRKVPNIKGDGFHDVSKDYYVHTGVIQVENPGLIKSDSSVGVYLNTNGSASTPLEYVGTVESYLDESKVNYILGENKTYLATEVFVKNNAMIKAGQPIVRIAGNDVTNDLQATIDNIKTMQDELSKLQQDVASLNTFGEDLTVYAPNDGIISYIRHNVGDEFEVSANADRWSSQIVEVYNANQMDIYTQVSDLDVNYIQVGSSVEVTVDALPNKKFEGTVGRMYQYTDNGKVVYRVQISVTGGDGLRPGMNSNCFVDAGKSEDTLLVPIESVFEDDYKQKVEVLNDDGVVEAVEIEIGLMNDRFVEVLSGLKEGQKVVTGSTQDLMPSQKVEKNNSLLPGKNE